MPKTRSIVLTLCAAGAAAVPALAQDGGDGFVSAEAGGLDLPGRSGAPRTREEAKQPPAQQTNAAPTPAPPPPPAKREGFGADALPWWDWPRATGDWGGLRSGLEDAGVTIAGSFTLNWSSVFDGGAETRAFSRRFLDVNATFDLDKLFGLKGGSVYADFYHFSGETGKPVGDAQGVATLETGRRLDQVGELWYQQVLLDGRVRLKVGKIDANTEFAFTDSGKGFLSANANWDGNLLAQPTYPDPAVGAVLFVYPVDGLYLGAGAFDGATQDGYATGSRGPATFFSDSKSDSWYFTGEAGVTWDELGPCGRGRLAAGGWGHTGRFDRFDGGTEDGTQGAYVLAEQQLLRRDGAEGDDAKKKGLFAIARWAWADPAVSVIRNHAAVAVVLKGTFAGRDLDEAGVMWSYADLSRRSGATSDEHLVEAYYRLQLLGSVSVSPTFQWVHDPSGDPTIDDAFVGTLSLTVTF